MRLVLERLSEQSKEKKLHVIVASHNEVSIRIAAQVMQNLGISKDQVSFGQIYGMSDYLTNPLGTEI